MSLFTPNNEINVSRSPFGSYINEKMIYDGRIQRISIEDIMMCVKRGNIFGVDYVILEALSELEFATSRMVTQYLLLKNIDIQQSKVSRRLKFMNGKKIISRFKFDSDEGNPNLRVYCLEKAGKYLLLSRNYKCNWKQSDNTRPIDMVKEICSRNQLLLNYREKIGEKIEKYEINPIYKLRSSGDTLKPHLLIKFKEEYGNETMIFHAIRSYEGYKSKTEELLKKYQEFYEYFSPTKDMYKPPILVLIGELDKHIFEIFKIILKNKIKLKNMEFRYTTDLRTLNENLNKSIIDFQINVEEGKNKVKIKELNFPLLKRE